MAVKKVGKKKKKWMRFRHRILWRIFKVCLYPYIHKHYDLRYEKTSLKDCGNALIIGNHQTEWDPVFAAYSFKEPIYYVANEALMDSGFFGKFLAWSLAPIPIRKATSDMRTVATMFQIAKEGGNIGIFPEGNTSPVGETVYMKKTVAAIAKKLKRPLVLYRIDGGYGVRPRWSDTFRTGGGVDSGTTRIILPEELEKMSVDELYKVIVEELYVNEHESGKHFESETLAEHAERMLYVCPNCGLSRLKTTGNIISCTKCSLTAEFCEDLSLKSDRGGFDFTDESKWYAFQENYIRELDRSVFTENPAYVEEVSVFREAPKEEEGLVKENISLKLFADRLEFGMKSPLKDETGGTEPWILPFDDIEASSLFKGNTLVLILKNKEIFQVCGSAEFNAVKFVNFIALHKNESMFELTGLDKYEGERDVKFLGF